MDSRRFRNALGQFPTGVVVATARAAAGELVGMTMSSFNSVSLDPPLILFSVHRQAHSFAVWQRIERRAISVLNEEQEQVSNQFARRGANKWDGITRLTGETGVPLLPMRQWCSNARPTHALAAGTTRSSSAASSQCTSTPLTAAGRWFSTRGAIASSRAPPPRTPRRAKSN
jgi:hypothetical protein